MYCTHDANMAKNRETNTTLEQQDLSVVYVQQYKMVQFIL